MKPVYEHFWNGERTLRSFVEATDKAVEWFGHVNHSRFMYGLSRLINETEEFLANDVLMVPTECNCPSAVQKRRLQENFKILRTLFIENPVNGKELAEICLREPEMAKRMRII